MSKILALSAALVMVAVGMPVMAQSAPPQAQDTGSQSQAPAQRGRWDFDPNTQQYFYRGPSVQQNRSNGPRPAQRYYEPSVAIQGQVLEDGAAQGQHAINVTRQLCEQNGGTFVPSRVRMTARSDVRSRVESQPWQQQWGGGRWGGRNVMTLDLNRALFGQPRLPQWYQNDAAVTVEVNDACSYPAEPPR